MSDFGVLVIAIPWLIGSLLGTFVPQALAEIHRKLFGTLDGPLAFYQDPKIIRAVARFMLVIASGLVIIHFMK